MREQYVFYKDRIWHFLAVKLLQSFGLFSEHHTDSSFVYSGLKFSKKRGQNPQNFRKEFMF